MKRILFDIETDGLLHELTKMHCLVARDMANPSEPMVCRSDKSPMDWSATLSTLDDADLYGHNILGFDLPALEKLYGFKPSGRVIDTGVLCSLAYPDEHLKSLDFERRGFPKRFAGHQTLEAWGHRLGEYKGDFKGPWHTCTEEMVNYCVQDTEVNLRLLDHLRSLKLSAKSVELEHAFADYLNEQRKRGVYFNVTKATALASELAEKIKPIDERLLGGLGVEWKDDEGVDRCLKQTPTPAHPGPHWVEPYTTPKTGERKLRLKRFNPGSDSHWVRYFVLRYGWKPKEYTDKGRVSFEEKVLQTLTFPEVPDLLERKVIDKRIATLVRGNGSLLKHVTPEGRIHQRVKHNGAVTSRCTHSSPNYNLPRVTTAYGPQFRECFEASPGLVLVGGDASGLELRCLAHRLAPYDGGRYVKVVTEGDAHSANQKAAGLGTRDKSKTFIYAYLYGAGDELLGGLVGGGVRGGAKVRALFERRTEGLIPLKKELEAQVPRGFLIGLDGRRVPVRYRHAVLNTRLQSDGAVIMKQATVHFREGMEAEGYPLGDGWWPVIHQHDELQVECVPELVDTVEERMELAFETAGIALQLRCPLAGEAKHGNNWAETH